MTDHAAQLRYQAQHRDIPPPAMNVMEEAADEIERLRAELATSREEFEHADAQNVHWYAEHAKVRAENEALRSEIGPRKAGALVSLVQHATRLVEIERDDARAERDGLLEQLQAVRELCDYGWLQGITGADRVVPIDRIRAALGVAATNPSPAPDALSVQCPRCLAPADNVCRTVLSGQSMDWSHPERWRAAGLDDPNGPPRKRRSTGGPSPAKETE